MVVRHSWQSPVCFAWGYGGQLSAPLEAFDLAIVVTVDPLHRQQGINHGKLEETNTTTQRILDSHDLGALSYNVNV